MPCTAAAAAGDWEPMDPVKLSIFAGVIVVAFILWRWLVIHKRNRRRAALMAAPFPKEWMQILEKNMPFYTHLPEDLKNQLHGCIQVLLAEKQFIGCGGQEITDQVRVTIAGQASVLLLNRKTRFFPTLKIIYIYPHTYVTKAAEFDGTMIIEGQSVRLGESWHRGPVVLAWDSIAGGVRNFHDAHNVVLHEFAHQLDQEDGSADGTPILESRSGYRSWARVLSAEYEQLRKKSAQGHPSVLSSYGATNPAEFFAVATEAFFEKPGPLRKHNPELYEELKHYYKLDPLQWDLKT